MTKGKVVLVPFPFDDLSAAKVRPAVCLTDPVGPHRHVILAFITSRIPADLMETDIVLDTSQPDFVTTGLRVSSTLRLHRLMTVSTSLILRELGELSPDIHSRFAYFRSSFQNCPLHIGVAGHFGLLLVTYQLAHS